MKNYSFLFWAYAVVWSGLSIYLFWLWRRMVAVDRRLDRLEQERRSNSKD